MLKHPSKHNRLDSPYIRKFSADVSLHKHISKITCATVYSDAGGTGGTDGTARATYPFTRGTFAADRNTSLPPTMNGR